MIDVREAAAIADRNPETVRRWIWSGRLPAHRRGNRLLVARQDLQVLLAESRSADASSAPSLAEWAEESRALRRTHRGPPEGVATAADLVLSDRRIRSGLDEEARA